MVGVGSAGAAAADRLCQVRRRGARGRPGALRESGGKVGPPGVATGQWRKRLAPGQRCEGPAAGWRREGFADRQRRERVVAHAERRGHRLDPGDKRGAVLGEGRRERRRAARRALDLNADFIIPDHDTIAVRKDRGTPIAERRLVAVEKDPVAAGVANHVPAFSVLDQAVVVRQAFFRIRQDPVIVEAAADRQAAFAEAF